MARSSASEGRHRSSDESRRLRCRSSESVEQTRYFCSRYVSDLHRVRTWLDLEDVFAPWVIDLDSTNAQGCRRVRRSSRSSSCAGQCHVIRKRHTARTPTTEAFDETRAVLVVGRFLDDQLAPAPLNLNRAAWRPPRRVSKLEQDSDLSALTHAHVVSQRTPIGKRPTNWTLQPSRVRRCASTKRALGNSDIFGETNPYRVQVVTKRAPRQTSPTEAGP